MEELNRMELLETQDSESACIVVLKLFGGLARKEVAESLNNSKRMVDCRWAYAKGWLLRHIRAQHCILNAISIKRAKNRDCNLNFVVRIHAGATANAQANNSWQEKLPFGALLIIDT